MQACPRNYVGSIVGLDRLSGKAHKLNAMQVKKLSSPGRYADGNCLYLTVSESEAKSWFLRIFVRGRRGILTVMIRLSLQSRHCRRSKPQERISNL